MRTGQQPISALFTLREWQLAGAVPANPCSPAGRAGRGSRQQKAACLTPGCPGWGERVQKNLGSCMVDWHRLNYFLPSFIPSFLLSFLNFISLLGD